MSTQAHPVIQNTLLYGESALLPFLQNCAPSERCEVIRQLQQYVPDLYGRYVDCSGLTP